MIAREVDTMGRGGQLGATLRLMDKLMAEGSINPRIVSAARQACGDVKGMKPEARLVWERVKSGVIYRRDPHGVEWVQDAHTTLLGEKAGDCDDQAVAAGAMLRALGHPCVAMAVQWKGRPGPSHAVVLDLASGMIVDPVGPEPDIWPGNRQVANLYTQKIPKGLVSGEMGTLDGWSINKLKKALKKVHNAVTRVVLPKPLRKIEAKISGAAERFDRSVSKDFIKAKKWSQKHRKELQAVAAVAAIAVGGYFLLPAMMSGAGAAAGAAGAAGAGAGAGAAAAGTAAASTAAATGGGFWATVGTTLAKTAATALVSTALKPKSAVEAAPDAALAAAAGPAGGSWGGFSGGYSGGGGGGYSGGGGGGGAFPNVGPDVPGSPEPVAKPTSEINPLLALAAVGLLFYVVK